MKQLISFFFLILTTVVFAQYKFVDRQDFTFSGYYNPTDVEIDRKTQEWMIVGNPEAGKRGEIVFLKRNGSSWSKNQRVWGDDIFKKVNWKYENNYKFGKFVSIYGNHVLIACQFGVVVYELINGVWIFEKDFELNYAIADIDMGENFFVIGHGIANNYEGVKVYHRGITGNWTLDQTLKSANNNAYNYSMGKAVAIDGKRIVVTEPNYLTEDFSYVYVYEKDLIGYWRLKATENYGVLDYGYSIDLDGDLISVSSESGNRFDILEYDGSSSVKLVRRNNAGNKASVSICSGIVAVGIPDQFESGTVKMYSEEGNWGNMMQMILPNNNDPTNDFGKVVSLSSNYLAVIETIENKLFVYRKKTQSRPNKPTLIAPYPSGSTINESSIKLEWTSTDPDNDELTYDVYFGKEGNVIQIAKDRPYEFYQYNNLESGEKYYWYVIASDGVEKSKYDTWIFFTSQLPSKPISPIPYKEAPNQSVNIELGWRNGGGATSYIVYFGINATPDIGEYKQATNYRSYSPGPLQYNTKYFWRIDAVNTSGTTTGDIWNFTTESNSISAPTNVKASDGTYTDKIKITWNSVSDADSYNLFRNTINNSSTSNQIAGGILNGSSTRTYNDDDNELIPSKRYYYWVKSKKIDGTLSEFSNSDEGRLKVAIIRPFSVVVPDNETVWTVGEQNVPISWNTGNLGGEVTIRLLVGIANIHSSPLIPNDGSYNSFDIPLNLVPGNNYRIWIYKDEVNNVFSDYFTISSGSNTPPSKATAVYPLDNSAIKHTTSVTLQWNASDDDGDRLFYDVYFGINGSAQKVSEDQENNFYIKSDLSPGINYSWGVSVSDGKVSTPGTVWDFTISEQSIKESDLSPSNYLFYPNIINAGSHPISVSFKLTNNGPLSLGSTNSSINAIYYISKNSTFGDSDDIKIGNKIYNIKLASGTQILLPFYKDDLPKVTIPNDASGSYFMFVNVEHVSPSTLVDPNKNNNHTVRSGTILVKGPDLTISSGQLTYDFGNTKVGNNPTPNNYTFTIKNTGGGTLTCKVIENANWMGATPHAFTLSANSSQSVKVTATTTNLSLGSYSETVSVTSNGGNKSGTVSVKIIESSQTPIITKQPINKSVNIGKSATFVVTATCTNPIGYQWWRVPFVSVAQSKITNISGKIEGANTSQLKIINSRESDNNTQYLCEVWNILDHENLWVNSNSATLTIVQLPKLAISSGNIAHNFGSVEEGNNPSKRSYTFTIKNTGGGTLTGKVNNSSNWLSKSASTFSITQNKTKTITITATTTSLTSGSYSETVSVTSNGGNKSETVLVKIVKNSETPIITQQPNNMSVTKGESAIFSVNASCTNPIGYQWWRSPFVSAAQSKITNISGKIEGANTSQLKILNTTESDNNTNYVCEVWNTLDHENLWVNSNAATLSIVQLPKLEISSGNIAHNFGSVEEGKNPANRTYTFTIKNSGGGTLTGNVSENASWLSRSTSSFSLGTNQIKTITITATTSSLTSGSYSETISVTSNDVNKSGTASVNIAKLPKLEISLGSLTHSFGSVEEGNNLSNRTYTFTIKNSGGGTLTGSVNENASWLSRSTSSFSLIANKIKTITITATTTSLNSGSYSETISVTSNGGNKSGTASVEIIEDPKLDISVGSLTFNFGRIENGTNPNPNKFSFEIKNTGSGSLDGNLSVTGNWLQLSSNTFSILSDRSESFSVSATISNLSSGNYLETITISSNGGTEQGTISCDVVTGIEDLFSETGIPDEYYLSNNFPNPFNPSTKISFGLPEQAAVSLMVYDITGKVVEEFLRNEQLPAGSYSYYFEAKNLSSGIYIYKLQAGEFIETKKLILMK